MSNNTLWTRQYESRNTSSVDAKKEAFVNKEIAKSDEAKQLAAFQERMNKTIERKEKKKAVRQFVSYCEQLPFTDQQNLKDLYNTDSLNEAVAWYLYASDDVMNESVRLLEMAESTSLIEDLRTCKEALLVAGMQSHAETMAWYQHQATTRQTKAETLRLQNEIKQQKEWDNPATKSSNVVDEPTEEWTYEQNKEDANRKFGIASSGMTYRRYASGKMWPMCGLTGRLDAQKKFWLFLQNQNAFEAMKADPLKVLKGKTLAAYKWSLFSDRYTKTKDQKRRRITEKYKNGKQLENSTGSRKKPRKLDNIEWIDGANFFDMYVKGASRFGHRLIGFKATLADGQQKRYVLDPYKRINGVATNDPIPYEKYAKKYPPLRMNFYQSSRNIVENT